MQYLGQHFLKNDQAIKRIIASLDIQYGEAIIEIGPGRGALTFPLAEECIQKKCRLIAIEKDTELVQNLELRIKNSEYKNIKIISGDALKILPKLLSSSEDDNIENYKLVGNIPYYITGKLLRTISELKNKPSVSVLMVQKEVAERICATPPHTNLLAAATQYWASPEIILHLKASEFDPPPEVDSAVIKLTTKKELGRQSLSVIASATEAIHIPQKIATLCPSEVFDEGGSPTLPIAKQSRILDKVGTHNDRSGDSNYTKEAENYYKLIHIIFKQPRKTLANNLRAGLGISKEEIEKILTSLNLPLNSRPQDISVEQILKMTSYLSFHT